MKCVESHQSRLQAKKNKITLNQTKSIRIDWATAGDLIQKPVSQQLSIIIINFSKIPIFFQPIKLRG